MATSAAGVPVDPQRAVVAQDAFHFFETGDEMGNVLIYSRFKSELADPSVGPCSRRVR